VGGAVSAFGFTPAAYLHAYVSTSARGYRKITIDGTTYTLADSGDAGQVWPDLITALDTAIDPAGWSAATTGTGAVRLTGPSATLVWPDRLGELLGMGVQPGDTMGGVTEAESALVPLGSIPLYGASWDEVEVDRSVEYEVDRLARTHGYVYGGARVWRWRLTTNAEGLSALRTGWALRSKVRVIGRDSGGTGTNTDAIASGNPIGYLDGWPLGLRSVRWLDDVRSVAEVDLLVSAVAL